MKIFQLMVLFFLTSSIALAATYYSGLKEQPVDFIDKKFKATHTLGCLKPNQVSNQYTPVDLYLAARQCFKENRPKEGYFLYKLAYAFSSFDAFRINNSEAGLELQGILNTGSQDKLDASQKELYLKEAEGFNNAQAAEFCKEFRRIGMPDYKPDYMTQYVSGTPIGFIRQLFFSNSPEKNWKEIIHPYCQAVEKEPSGSPANCILPKDVTNKLTPVVLYSSALQCFREERVEEGTFLFIVGSAYKKFDRQRVSDEDAAGEADAFLANKFYQLTPEQQTVYYKKLDTLFSSADKKQSVCDALNRLGMPDYYPQYMMEDKTKTSGGLRSGVDFPQIWKMIVRDYC